MKKFLLALLMLVTAVSAAQAQEEENDSLVSVIGWFCTGDTLEYIFGTEVYSVAGNDTTMVEDGGWTKFRICVTDSTKKGYMMEYTPLEVENEDTTTLQGRMRLMAARASLGTRVIFSTDEVGRVKEIVNWKEVYEQSLARINQITEAIYQENPALSSEITQADMQKSLRKSFDDVFGSKTKMLDAFVNLKLLFIYHGLSLPLGESEVKSEGEDIHYYVTRGKMEDEEAASDDDYQLLIKMDFPEEHGVKNLNNYFYNYFPDGWPRGFLVTNVEHFGGRQKITLFHLDWVSKSWR